MAPKQLPVYIFSGFLECGKTTFIQGTLEDTRFNAGEKTLLLVCEEGETDYDLKKLPVGSQVTVKTLEEPGDLDEKVLALWAKESDCERVMVEYNGMWQIQTFYDAMPDGWMPYQNMLFADGRTFINYNANMRALVVDKLRDCEVVIFNRIPKDADTMAFHKIVRGVSRRCEIVYEFEDGTAIPDEIEDPLPFDIEAPVIEVEDRDYALFYRDLTEDPKKYKGKTVRFKGQAAVDKRFPSHVCAIGRHIMTCCAADITFCPLVAQFESGTAVVNGAWYDVTAEIDLKFSRLYGKKGPVFLIRQLMVANPPEEQVATFY
ncbi:MAG: GTPase [Clostridia bacterium]|nr:GTPase [Clostridia bacterium]